MSENKRRQFWLADVFTQDFGEILVAFKHHKNIKGSIHVIEYDASREKAIEGMREALILSIEPFEWWTKDYPNDGEYTRKSYEALTKIREALAEYDKVIQVSKDTGFEKASK